VKLLVINPNTTQAVTDVLVKAARSAASRGTAIKGVTGESGPAVVASRADNIRAARNCIELARKHARGRDAVILGISLDTALAKIRRILDVPVVGMTQAGLHVAATLADRYGVLTFGRHMVPLYRELVKELGLTARLAGIGAVDLHPTAVFTDFASVVRQTTAEARKLAKRGAGAIVLAGAVYAGMRPRLQKAVPVPLVDGMQSAVMLAEGLIRLRSRETQ
jgi:allantoin racemase